MWTSTVTEADTNADCTDIQRVNHVTLTCITCINLAESDKLYPTVPSVAPYILTMMEHTATGHKRRITRSRRGAWRISSLLTMRRMLDMSWTKGEV